VTSSRRMTAGTSVRTTSRSFRAAQAYARTRMIRGSGTGMQMEGFLLPLESSTAILRDGDLLGVHHRCVLPSFPLRWGGDS
jgi:hypothetical protein